MFYFEMSWQIQQGILFYKTFAAQITSDMTSSILSNTVKIGLAELFNLSPRLQEEEQNLEGILTAIEDNYDLILQSVMKPHGLTRSASSDIVSMSFPW